MKKVYNVLAIDLGASSGRGILYTFDGKSLREKVVLRFANGAEEEKGHLVWNAAGIYKEICRAIRFADEACGKVDSIGVDTWGVDFGLIGKDGRLLENPRHYRDAVNTEMRRKYAEKDKAFFDIAGVSVNDFNTTYQLLARKEEKFDWSQVQYLLFMPQLFGYFLTGVAATEATIASTGGFFVNGTFDKGFLREAGVPSGIFPPVRKTFAALGSLNEQTKRLSGISYDLPVILSPGHDTACAVLCCKERSHPLYLSSGTWSLFGTVEEKPVLSDMAFYGKYTNELGGDGNVRFLRNIMGMWVIQECRREWADAGMKFDYPAIVRMAESAEVTGAYIDLNDDIFFSPGQMATKVCEYVREKQGIQLMTVGEIAACVYQSMAMSYSRAFEELKKITGREYKVLQILGGGSQNAYLNGIIERKLGIPVLAGSIEASSLGNALGQLVGLGAGSLQSLREKIF